MMEFPETFKVIVKPRSRASLIKGYDPERKAFMIELKSPAEKNKANKELLKLLRKKTGKQAFIITGLASHEKIIRLELPCGKIYKEAK